MKRGLHILIAHSEEVDWVRVGALELAFLGSIPDFTKNQLHDSGQVTSPLCASVLLPLMWGDDNSIFLTGVL